MARLTKFFTFVVFSILTASMLSGCFRRDPYVSITGQLRVFGSPLTLRDANGRLVSFETSLVALDYRGTSAFGANPVVAIRTLDGTRGVLLEVPARAMRNPDSFAILREQSGQVYDISGERDTENTGQEEFERDDGCTGPGHCCQTETRTSTDSDGKVTIEFYEDCGYHFDCPGSMRVLYRRYFYIDHFVLRFTDGSDDRAPAATFQGSGRPFSEDYRIRELSECRT